MLEASIPSAEDVGLLFRKEVPALPEEMTWKFSSLYDAPSVPARAAGGRDNVAGPS